MGGSENASRFDFACSFISFSQGSVVDEKVLVEAYGSRARPDVWPGKISGINALTAEFGLYLSNNKSSDQLQ